MEFGKLENVDNVHFQLPPDDVKNFRKNFSYYEKPTLYLGCPIWVNKQWEGKVYPLGSPKDQYLKFYAKKFNTIELNSTHYHIPDDRMISRWKEAVGPSFRFSPKFPQSISHHSQLRKCEDETKYFIDNLLGLKENLGTSFLQLPPNFGMADLSTLESFFKIIPSEFSLALEFRHPSWFYGGNLIEEAFELLENYKISSVITDVAGRRDVAHTSLTGKSALIRFIGNSMHPTDFIRMDDWVEKIVDWLNSGLESVYFFAHQPDNTLAPETASYFIQKFNQITQLELKDPLELLPQSQIELF